MAPRPPSPAEPLVEPVWTPRQKQALDLITQGHTNFEIAQELEVSLEGAKWHVREILSKLGVRRREQAAEYWQQHQRPRARLGRWAGMFVSGIGASATP